MKIHTSKLMLLSLALCSATQNNCMDTFVTKENQSIIKFDELGKQLFRELIGDSFTKMSEGCAGQFEFECSKEILPVLALAIQLNATFKACDFNDTEIFTKSLQAFKKQNIHTSLSMQQLIEFANILAKHFFAESLLDAICRIIIVKSFTEEMQIDERDCSDQVAIKIARLYYLFHEKILPNVSDDILAQALSFTLDELMNEGNLATLNSWKYQANRCCSESICYSVWDGSTRLNHVLSKHPEKEKLQKCDSEDCSRPYVEQTQLESHKTLFHPTPTSE